MTTTRIELSSLAALMQDAENGDAAASFQLAQYYFQKLKLPRVEINLQHIENGCLSSPHENDPQAKKAYQYASQALAGGDVRAHFYLANLHLNGWGTKVDIFRAQDHATQGANHKDKHANDLSTLINLTVENIYSKMSLTFSYRVSLFSTTNLTLTPERHAKIIRRCLALTPKPTYAKLMDDLERLYRDANEGFVNPFNKKERFTINVNYALATKNRALLAELMKEDKVLFTALTEEELRERAITPKVVKEEEYKELPHEKAPLLSEHEDSTRYRRL